MIADQGKADLADHDESEQMKDYKAVPNYEDFIEGEPTMFKAVAFIKTEKKHENVNLKLFE